MATRPEPVLPEGMTRDRRGRLHLTRAQKDAVNRFLFDSVLVQGPAPLNSYGVRGVSREQWSESYQCWIRGGRAWQTLDQGGTGQMAALCWYQHLHRPGSREWRPAKIIPALVRAALDAVGASTEVAA